MGSLAPHVVSTDICGEIAFLLLNDSGIPDSPLGSSEASSMRRGRGTALLLGKVGSQGSRGLH